MQLLDLNNDVIMHICARLELTDLMLLGSSCQSLRGYYPKIEAYQRRRKRQVLADICSVMYDCANDTESTRIAGDTVVTYGRESCNNNILTIEYCRANECADEFIAEIDARPYKGNTVHRRFSIARDRCNWQVELCGHVEMKRNALAGATQVTVYMFEEQSIEIKIDSRYIVRGRFTNLPMWVDLNGTDFRGYPK